MVWRNAVWNSRVYRLLLNLYPADFRETYGDAMVCVFEETLANAYAQAGGNGVFATWLTVLADLLSTALAERAAHFTEGCAIERKSALGATIGIHALVLLAIIWVRLHTIPPAIQPCEKEKVQPSSAVFEPPDVPPRAIAPDIPFP
jgi:hypothetical protein